MEEGSIEGLYVTSVACCQELWILIMDAGTGIQQQVPLPNPPSFPLSYSTSSSTYVHW